MIDFFIAWICMSTFSFIVGMIFIKIRDDITYSGVYSALFISLIPFVNLFLATLCLFYLFFKSIAYLTSK